MEPMRIFVSHSSADNAFCRPLVQGLHQAGADVWYDERDLGPGLLTEKIGPEVANRRIFLLIVSRAAANSNWVKAEFNEAFVRTMREAGRILLPVVAQPIEQGDVDKIPFLDGLKRVEASSLQPLPPERALAEILRLLELSAGGAGTSVPSSQDVDELIAHAIALAAQQQYIPALLYLERAASLRPQSFEAWFNIAFVQQQLHRRDLALAAADQAIRLNARHTGPLTIKAFLLNDLGRAPEGLSAADQAIALDSQNAQAWIARAYALGMLEQQQACIDATERALALDSDSRQSAGAWAVKANVLLWLNRLQEALAAADRAVALDREAVLAWRNRAAVLQKLNRVPEALESVNRALALDPNDVGTLMTAIDILVQQSRFAEALDAINRVIAIDSNDWAIWAVVANAMINMGRPQDALHALDQTIRLNPPHAAVAWRGRAELLQQMGRHADAQEALRRARLLGG